MASSGGSPKAMDSLPPELLCQIFDYLSGAPPSDTRLHDQPFPTMLALAESQQILKPLSLVSRKWRSVVLPILFRHVVWTVDRWDPVLASDASSPDPISSSPALSFIRAHGLGSYVSSLTLVVGDSMQGMYRLDAAGATAENASPPVGDRYGRLVSLSDMRAGASKGAGLGGALAAFGRDNNWLWDMLFGLMDPRRITFIASPRMLASLLSRMLFLEDAWSFRNQCHILSLSRDPRYTGGLGQRAAAKAKAKTGLPGACCGANPVAAAPVPCNLFSIRPWTALLLNEGSSTRVYQTYEFFLKRPPSILGALLGCEEAPNDRPLIPATVRSLSYVGIFPLSPHFNTLVANLPRIDRLFVQLVPRNGILDDREEMRNVQVGDLWMERNSCYSMVMQQLFDDSGDWASSDSGAEEDEEEEDVNDEDEEEAVEEEEEEEGEQHGSPARARGSNWRYLREFESGDAADKEAWDMAVVYVCASGTSWRVEREGVFVKRRPGDPPANPPSAGSSSPVVVPPPPPPPPDGDDGGGGVGGVGGFELLSVPQEEGAKAYTPLFPTLCPDTPLFLFVSARPWLFRSFVGCVRD